MVERCENQGKGTMQTNKFWLYYSMAMIGLMYPYDVRAGVYVANNCQDAMNSFGGCNQKDIQDACYYAQEIGDLDANGGIGCATTTGGAMNIYLISDCETVEYISGVKSCGTCDSGYDLMSLRTLKNKTVPTDFSWGDGADHDNSAWKAVYDEASSASQIPSDIDVCVQCVEGGTWQSMGSNKYQKVPSVCGVAQAAQYGCASNSFLSGGTGANITCTLCSGVIGALCSGWQNGHTNGLTCDANNGYYKYNASTCHRCPSMDGAYGKHDGGVSSDLTGCFMPSTTSLSDSDGTYHFSSSCPYKTMIEFDNSSYNGCGEDYIPYYTEDGEFYMNGSIDESLYACDVKVTEDNKDFLSEALENDYFGCSGTIVPTEDFCWDAVDEGGGSE